MVEITKNEIKYIAGATIVSFIWFQYVIPYFTTSNPFTNFLIFNLGIFLIFQVFLKGFITNKFLPFMEAIGLTLLFFAMDIGAPPYCVTRTGELLSGLTLTNSGSDYIMALLGQSMGIHGSLLYFFVYLIVPILALFLAAFLLKDLLRRL
jgi:cell division protein FtsW (lipid II flippase)